VNPPLPALQKKTRMSRLKALLCCSSGALEWNGSVSDRAWTKAMVLPDVLKQIKYIVSKSLWEWCWSGRARRGRRLKSSVCARDLSRCKMDRCFPKISVYLLSFHIAALSWALPKSFRYAPNSLAAFTKWRPSYWSCSVTEMTVDCWESVGVSRIYMLSVCSWIQLIIG